MKTAKALTCEDVDEVAADFALGLVDGETRSGVVAHIEKCAACRAQVNEFTDAADSLLLLVPETEPPAGFESRVLEKIGRRRPNRLWLGAIAAVLILVLATAAAVAVLSRRSPSNQTTAVVATMRSTAGTDVGRAIVTNESDAWLYMSATSGEVKGKMACDLVLKDGSVMRLGEFNAEDGSAEWDGSTHVPKSRIREIRVTDAGGTVVGSARIS